MLFRMHGLCLCLDKIITKKKIMLILEKLLERYNEQEMSNIIKLQVDIQHFNLS
jgi:hypothetical protein